MPFNEALFWFGLTAFGTGLYVLFEATVKRLYSIGLTAIGVLACVYSVYRHYHPESPAIHLWVILLILTWALLAYAVYIRRFSGHDKQIQQLGALHQEEVRKLEVAHGAELWRARESRRLCDEELRESKRKLGIFTPLQIDTFHIAKELMGFAAGMGEEPRISSTDYPDTRDGQERFMVDRHRILDPWHTEFRSKFRLHFGDRLNTIVDRLSAEKVDCGGFLEAQARTGIDNTPDALRTAEHLVSAAHRLTGIRVYPPFPYESQELEMMDRNERQRRLREEPGFADTWESHHSGERK